MGNDSTTMASGLAFPAYIVSYRGEDKVTEYHTGMSKREWFAGMAMQGLLAHGGMNDVGKIAHMSLRYADAMLARQEKEVS